jgi:hypothetical protein
VDRRHAQGARQARSRARLLASSTPPCPFRTSPGGTPCGCCRRST